MLGALRAGAAGYFRKDAEPELLIAAGRTYIDPSGGRVLLNATGHGTHETFKTHIASLFHKLQVETARSPVVQALKRRLIDLDELQ